MEDVREKTDQEEDQGIRWGRGGRLMEEGCLSFFCDQSDSYSVKNLGNCGPFILAGKMALLAKVLDSLETKFICTL